MKFVGLHSEVTAVLSIESEDLNYRNFRFFKIMKKIWKKIFIGLWNNLIGVDCVKESKFHPKLTEL